MVFLLFRHKYYRYVMNNKNIYNKYFKIKNVQESAHVDDNIVSI